jgi:hypothetical protein
MPTPGSARHPGPLNVIHILLMGLVAGMDSLPFCLGLDDFFAEMAFGELGTGLGHPIRTDSSSVLEALALQSDCSDEFWDCKEPGALADLEDLRCFSICITVHTGCRSCCADSTCYQPPVEEGSLGACTACLEGTENQCVTDLFAAEKLREPAVTSLVWID